MQALRRWFFGVWQGFREWIDGMDACEICGNEQADNICVGCDRRICGMCDSGYYRDAEICQECRKNISPQEEDEDRENEAEALIYECTCPVDCELSPEEHAFITKYAKKAEA